jgi:valyl-tRNA synthetase
VDLDNEIAKCDKKLDLVRLNLQKVVKLESQPEYEETVPENVRAANLEKVMFWIFIIMIWDVLTMFVL